MTGNEENLFFARLKSPSFLHGILVTRLKIISGTQGDTTLNTVGFFSFPLKNDNKKRRPESSPLKRQEKGQLKRKGTVSFLPVALVFS